MDDQYYIRVRGQIQGPFTKRRLWDLAKRGRFSSHYHVSVDRENWERASDHPDLFPEVGPPKIRKSVSGGELNLSEPGEVAGGESVDEPDFQEQETVEPEWFYTDGNNQEAGPIPLTELKRLVSTGQVTADSYLWHSSLPDWVPASTIADLSVDHGPEPESGPRLESGGAVRATAPMAVGSFVLGLLGASMLFCIGSVLAVVFGHIALKQINDSGNNIGGRGLAISGLILGYAVLAITLIVGIVVICVTAVRGIAA